MPPCRFRTMGRHLRQPWNDNLGSYSSQGYMARRSRNQTGKQAFRFLIQYIGVGLRNTENKRETPCRYFSRNTRGMSSKRFFGCAVGVSGNASSPGLQGMDEIPSLLEGGVAKDFTEHAVTKATRVKSASVEWARQASRLLHCLSSSETSTEEMNRKFMDARIQVWFF